MKFLSFVLLAAAPFLLMAEEAAPSSHGIRGSINNESIVQHVRQSFYLKSK